MKFALCLLVLLPMVYSFTVDLENLSEEEKRFLFKDLPSLQDVKTATCTALSSDAGHQTCEAACGVALATIPYGSLVSSLCGPACSTLHC